MRTLLEYSLNINAKDDDLWTPLHWSEYESKISISVRKVDLPGFSKNIFLNFDFFVF